MIGHPICQFLGGNNKAIWIGLLKERMDFRGNLETCRYACGSTPQDDKVLSQVVTHRTPDQKQPIDQPKYTLRKGWWHHWVPTHIGNTNGTGGMGSDEGLVQKYQKQITTAYQGHQWADHHWMDQPVPSGFIHW